MYTMTFLHPEIAGDSVRDFLAAAEDEARKGHSPEIYPGHFLLAALADEGNPVRQELSSHDEDIELLEEIISQDLLGSLLVTGDIPLAVESTRMVDAVLGAAVSHLLGASIPDDYQIA